VVEVSALAIHRPKGGRLYQIQTTDEAEEPTWNGVGEECMEMIESWEKNGNAFKALVANLLLMLPDHEATEVLSCYKNARSLRENHWHSQRSQKSPAPDQNETSPDSGTKSSPC
jgi:hypothetical protein